MTRRDEDLLTSPDQPGHRVDPVVRDVIGPHSRFRLAPALAVFALGVLGFATVVGPTSGHAAPATCGLTSPAFCDTFDQGPSAIRGRVVNTPGSAGNLALLVDVPVADLRAGLNTLEMLPANAPMDYPPAVANIDLILALDAGPSPPPPTNLRFVP